MRIVCGVKVGKGMRQVLFTLPSVKGSGSALSTHEIEAVGMFIIVHDTVDDQEALLQNVTGHVGILEIPKQGPGVDDGLVGADGGGLEACVSWDTLRGSNGKRATLVLVLLSRPLMNSWMPAPSDVSMAFSLGSMKM